jgi:hypothetical protein
LRRVTACSFFGYFNRDNRVYVTAIGKTRSKGRSPVEDGQGGPDA